MTKTFIVEVVPQVLIWLRTSVGWEIDEVAKKLHTSIEAVKDMKSGKKTQLSVNLISSRISRKGQLHRSFYPNKSRRNQCLRITDFCLMISTHSTAKLSLPLEWLWAFNKLWF